MIESHIGLILLNLVQFSIKAVKDNKAYVYECIIGEANRILCLCLSLSVVRIYYCLSTCSFSGRYTVFRRGCTIFYDRYAIFFAMTWKLCTM